MDTIRRTPWPVLHAVLRVRARGPAAPTGRELVLRRRPAGGRGMTSRSLTGRSRARAGSFRWCPVAYRSLPRS